MNIRAGWSAAAAIVFAVSLNGGVSAAEGNEIIRGLVTPRNQAVISSEISARVVELPFRSGNAFGKGDTLVQFDCAMYEAQRDAAAANRDARKTEYENAQELLSYKATSPIQVEILNSEAKQAQAQFEIERIRVEGCRIKAPYDGRVMVLHTNEFESVSAGTNLLSILSDETLEIELIAPSKWLSWLSQETEFLIQIDETNTEYTARVSRIGAAVDPVSQTVQVIGTFDDEAASVRAGMSGSAIFEFDQ